MQEEGKNDDPPAVGETPPISVVNRFISPRGRQTEQPARQDRWVGCTHTWNFHPKQPATSTHALCCGTTTVQRVREYPTGKQQKSYRKYPSRKFICLLSVANHSFFRPKILAEIARFSSSQHHPPKKHLLRETGQRHSLLFWRWWWGVSFVWALMKHFGGRVPKGEC